VNLQKLLKNAVKKAKSIFSINVPLIINEERLPNKPLLEQMGYYDCYEDKVIIFINKIQQTVSEFNLDQEKMITYYVCHEFGHAKQIAS